MDTKIVMSGMRPTGSLHLGNWAGALMNWLKLQENNQCFFSIVDWHSLTTDYQDPSAIRNNIHEVLLDWLSVGINPQKSVVYVQSAVKEVAELYLLLSMLTPLGRLERVPTFKEQQLQLNDRELNTFGFLGYPLLQTVDIVIVRGNVVPVGEDQVFHLEFAREIVRRFNNFYGTYFDEPMEYLTPAPKLSDIDGRKMSKSYDNAIYLSDSAETVAAKIKPMVTDTRRKRRTDAGVPDDCPVFALHKIFTPKDEKSEIITGCTSAAIGCIECKKILIKYLNALLEPFRQKRQEFENNHLDDILAEGNQKAAEIAVKTLEDVRRLVKI